MGYPHVSPYVSKLAGRCGDSDCRATETHAAFGYSSLTVCGLWKPPSVTVISPRRKHVCVGANAIVMVQLRLGANSAGSTESSYLALSPHITHSRGNFTAAHQRQNWVPRYCGNPKSVRFGQYQRCRPTAQSTALNQFDS